MDFEYLKRIKGKSLIVRVKEDQEVLSLSKNDVLSTDLVYKGMREKYVMKTKYRKKKFRIKYKTNIK